VRFDEQQRLLLFNRLYAEMYGLDPGQLWIGMTLRDVVDLRYAAGTGPACRQRSMLYGTTVSAWRTKSSIPR
jgi:hypothetical protein